MTTPFSLQWGILSTARINRALLPPLRQSPRNTLMAVASRSLENAQNYARENSIPRAYGSYEELLANPQIQVIYNPLPNHLHAEWSIKALQAGKNVLCEKPFALSLAEVDAMSAAARQAGRVLTEAFMYRHHPQTLKAREIIASGALGKVSLVRGAFTFPFSRAGNFRANPQMGGGSLWDVGCYPVSFTRFLLGEEPVEVFAWQVLNAEDVDESFAGQLRFPSGALAQFDSGFRAPYRTFMEIVGSEASLEIPVPFKPQFNEKMILRRGGQASEILIPGEALYQGEVEDMADAVLLGKPPRISLAESRANLAVLLALAESARTDKPVFIQ
ncbi:MAG: Gfo/Idh/MocA family oxidoreductase [Anaerolineales bacterium]